MLWVFKELARWITAETDLPVLLPGQPDTLQEPHVWFEVRKMTVDHPDFGHIEFDEMIAGGSRDSRYRGPSVVGMEMDIVVSALGSSPDFANAYFDAVRKLAKILKVGHVPVPFIAQQDGRAHGAGLEVRDMGMISDYAKADGITATLWSAGWECTLRFPTREDEEYAVEPVDYTETAPEGPAPIG